MNSSPSFLNFPLTIRATGVALIALAAGSIASAQEIDYVKYSQVGYYDENGDVIANQQSWVSPFGLQKVAQVQVGASDTAAEDFQTNYLPSITSLLDQELGGEASELVNSSALSLDPTKLTLSTESTARVYFIGEGAGYRNTLGFNALAPGSDIPAESITSDASLIFPDASTTGAVDPLSTSRRWNAPLTQGDFVDLGTFDAGTTLDFFLIANGANGGNSTYTASASRNPDQLNHVVAFALPDSPFLIVGFEDLFGGGDKDYNDLLFAIDIGATNIQRLVSTPEPSTWAIMGGFLMLGLWRVRRPSSASNLDTV